MKTIRTAILGDLTLRLVEKDKKFIGIVVSDGPPKVQIEGSSADDVWRRLHDEAGKANPRYFGFDGARARFLRFFPEGFRSPRYLAEERNYKVAAKSDLDNAAPLESAAEGTGYGDAVLAAFQTNLLSPFEKMRVRSVLRSATANDFIRAAARFTLGEGKAALMAMASALKPHDAAKWTIVTYLPFLWRPERHMFLKPEATKDFAARVGHRFESTYEAQLDFAIYENLLDLVQTTSAELSDLEPRDQIDVQSFIWVVGNYQEKSPSA